MKPLKNQATSIAGLSALSTEAKICFGAAGGCLILGLIGFAINALTTMETTLSAFLVISAFYFMLGGISWFQGNSAVPDERAARDNEGLPSDRLAHDGNDELIESAA